MCLGINIFTDSQDRWDVNSEMSAVEILLCDEGAVPVDLEDPVLGLGLSVFPEMSREDWYYLQRQGDCLARFTHVIENESDTETLNRVEEPEIALLCL